MSGSPPHLLKVFSGPHVGAEILLADGEHVIGSHDECDVILSDRFIAPRHARVIVAGKSFRCAPIDEAGVFVSGQKVDEAGRELAPFEYFTLGNTHLALGPADAAWPVIEFPDFQLSATRAVPVSAPSKPEAPSKSVETPRERSGGRRVAITVVILLILASLSWGGFEIWRAGETPTPVADTTTEPQLRALVAECRREGAVLEMTSKHGRFHVDGFVATAADRAKLWTAVQKINPAIRCRIFDGGSLAAAVGEVLQGNGLSLVARAGPPGDVIVTGTGVDRDRWRLVQKQIREDVRMLRNLDDQVVFEAKAALPLIPTETRIPGDVKAPPGEVEVAPAEGQSPPSESPEHGPPETSDPPPGEILGPRPDRGESDTPGEEPFLLEYVSVSVGRNACLTLAGGQRLFAGAEVGHGYRIQSITPTALVLVRGDVQRIVPLGGAK